MKILEILVPSNFLYGVPFYSEADEIESALNYQTYVFSVFVKFDLELGNFCINVKC